MSTDQITLYHNPRCSKSRATLQLLQDYLAAGETTLRLQVVEYLLTPLAAADIQRLQGRLGVGLRDMMRAKEAAFDEHNLSDASTEAQLLDALAQSPILLERPIVEFDGQAAIGRPPEAVLKLLPQR